MRAISTSVSRLKIGIQNPRLNGNCVGHTECAIHLCHLRQRVHTGSNPWAFTVTEHSGDMLIFAVLIENGAPRFKKGCF